MTTVNAARAIAAVWAALLAALCALLAPGGWRALALVPVALFVAAWPALAPHGAHSGGRRRYVEGEQAAWDGYEAPDPVGSMDLAAERAHRGQGVLRGPVVTTEAGYRAAYWPGGGLPADAGGMASGAMLAGAEPALPEHLLAMTAAVREAWAPYHELTELEGPFEWEVNHCPVCDCRLLHTGALHCPRCGWQEPEPSRLADTGDIRDAALLADISAALRAQDADTARYLTEYGADLAALRRAITESLN